MPDLLVELFSEEIPARMQRKAAGDFRKLLTDRLVDAGLTYEGAKEYWTPRRIALDLRGLTPRSADIREEKKGPRTDAPEKAIEGFMRGAGLGSIEEAEIRSDPKKGDFYVAVIEKSGRDAREIISEAVPEIIRSFPWPKSMRWGEASRQSGALKWVRPLQSILCLFGPETEETEIIDFEVSGIRSSNETRGHRFHAPDTFKTTRFDDFSAKLEKCKVILDPQKRKDSILTSAKNLAFANGFELVEDDGLLDEVTNLVEWPEVLLGEFDEEFLAIPKEVIQLTIRENQKCFVLKQQGSAELTNRFLLVTNIVAADGGAEIARGNAKVVNARLSDAKFFWETDLNTIKSKDGFKTWITKLDGVTFHAKLGSVGDRIKRIATLAERIAEDTGADGAKASRAAVLAKADLNSAMVYEFPELQGLMGRYYALEAGEDLSVATAIEQHYSPLGPSDEVPSEPVAMTVALADKIDVLNGFWSIDEKPTGSKDPFALRRAALGIIRIILENEITISLNEYVSDSDLLSFIHDRLKVYLRDQNVRHDIIDATLTDGSDNLLTVAKRAKALQKLIDSEDGKNLLAGYKRAANILAAEAKKQTAVVSDVVQRSLNDPNEKKLFEVSQQIRGEAEQAIANEAFEEAMISLGKLRDPIDAFFENVMVNDEDAEIRANRLSLLKQISTTVETIADFSKISG